MRQVAAAVASALVVASCSIIYNPDNIHVKDAARLDAPPDVAINPQNISVHDVSPSRIDEGQGDGGGRPVVLVVHGSNFTHEAMVALTQTQITGSNAPELTVDNGSAVVSSDGSYIVVPVIATAGSGSSENVTASLTVTVTEPDAPTAMLPSATTWYGHDELTTVSQVSTGSGAQLFSKVDLGTTPPTIVATGGSGSALLVQAFSSISIGGVTASGVAGNAGTGGSGGPGGCSGGNSASSGNCYSAGGKGSSSTSIAFGTGAGGGGAGFVNAGSSGGAAGGGMGGSAIADNLLTAWTSSPAGSIAAGGGGGGTSDIVGVGSQEPGGGGGGGGGFVELVAGGTVMVTGLIDVSGGAGGSDNSVGGGGGAGGMVILTGASLSVTMPINALGGAGGASGASAGGSGSIGRVRWDSPATGITTGSAAVTQGPAFVGTDLVLPSESLQLVGSPHASIEYYDTNAAGEQTTMQMTSFNGNGSVMIQPSLTVGWNHVCVFLVGGMPGSFQAERCIDVAYLP
jgi:hypothetical protein